MTKIQLKEALNKLKDNKLIRNDIPANNPFTYCKNGNLEYNNKDNFRDQIITFLICNKFNFDFKDLVNEMDDIYDNCEYYLRHNMILSINDGAMMYKNDKSQFMYYPIINNKKLPNSLLQPFNSNIDFSNSNIKCNKYEHIIGFLNYMYMGTSTTSILYPKMTNYLGTMRAKSSIDEKKSE